MNLRELTDQAKRQSSRPFYALENWAENVSSNLLAFRYSNYAPFWVDLVVHLRKAVRKEEIDSFDECVEIFEAQLEELQLRIRNRSMSLAIEEFNKVNEILEAKEYNSREDSEGVRWSVPSEIIKNTQRIRVLAGAFSSARQTWERVVEDVVGLTFLEAIELRIILKEEYGIEPTAGGAVITAVPVTSRGHEIFEEKTEFDVVLTEVGDNMINVIKEVRGITGLGLKEAKDLVESGGKIKEGAAKEEAEEIKAILQNLGAKVNLI